MTNAAQRSPYAVYDREAPAGVPTVDSDPFSVRYFDDPWPELERMRETGPYVWLSRYCIGAVARYDQAREVLSDWKRFSSARGVGMEDFEIHGRFRLPSLLNEADPPAHTLPRGLISGVLAPPVLKGLRAGFEQEARQLVDTLVQRRTFDAIRDLARAYPLRVFPDAVGIQRDGREKLLPHADMLFNSFGPRNELFEASRGNADFAYVEAQGQRANLAPGGLGLRLHEAAQQAGFPEDKAAMLVRALVQAGLDTTINAIGAVLFCLARFPDQLRKLRDNPDLIKGAFDEAIRFESPVQTEFRTATCDTEIGGLPVRSGEKILVLLGGANRDPRKWEQPDRFDIERSSMGHLGFGVGIHMCVGQMLARLEAEIVLREFVKRCDSFEIVGEPVRHYNNTVRGLASLPIEVIPSRK